MSSPSYLANREKGGDGIDAMKTELHRLLDKKYPTNTNKDDIHFLMSSLANKLTSRKRNAELKELKEKYNATRGASSSTRKNRKSKKSRKQRKNRKTRRN